MSKLRKQIENLATIPATEDIKVILLKLSERIEAIEQRQNGLLCKCGQPENSIRHSNAAASSVDAHTFKPKS